MATTDARPKAEQNGKATEAPAWEGGLSERIAWVMGEIDDIRATGKNQFSAAALSIGDVEAALRPSLAQAQVVTRFSMTDLEQIDKALWKATFRVSVSGGGEAFEDQWIDVGGSPMAASSFARKGYLKALFHISEDKDEQGKAETAQAPQRRASAPVQRREAAPPADVWKAVEPEDPFLAKAQEAKAQLDAAEGGDALLRNAFNVDGLRGCLAPLSGGKWGLRPGELKKLTPPMRDSALARLYEAIAAQTEPIRDADGSVAAEPIPL